MEFILIGIATSFNFIIIVSKFRRQRYIDAILDMTIMGIICVLFSTGFQSLTVGMIASTIVSMYLLFKPIKPNKTNKRRKIKCI